MNIKKHSNKIYLLIIIFIAVILYFIDKNLLSLIAIILAPFTTLVVYSMVEENNAKWHARYDAFKTLYANRGNIVNDKTINCLNSIDILFIDDKNVKDCWKNLYETFNKATEIEAQILGATNENQLKELLAIKDTNQGNMKTGLVELLMAMSIVLGLNKDITYRNISEFYIPVGFTERKVKNDAELNYYESGAKFFKEYKP